MDVSSVAVAHMCGACKTETENRNRRSDGSGSKKQKEKEKKQEEEIMRGLVGGRNIETGGQT